MKIGYWTSSACGLLRSIHRRLIASDPVPSRSGIRASGIRASGIRAKVPQAEGSQVSPTEGARRMGLSFTRTERRIGILLVTVAGILGLVVWILTIRKLPGTTGDADYPIWEELRNHR